MKKKTYLTPRIKVRTVGTEGILAGSGTSMGISDDPATEPAHSKGNSFFSSDESSSTGSSSLWGSSEE